MMFQFPLSSQSLLNSIAFPRPSYFQLTQHFHPNPLSDSPFDRTDITAFSCIHNSTHNRLSRLKAIQSTPIPSIHMFSQQYKRTISSVLRKSAKSSQLPQSSIPTRLKPTKYQFPPNPFASPLSTPNRHFMALKHPHNSFKHHPTFHQPCNIAPLLAISVLQPHTKPFQPQNPIPTPSTKLSRDLDINYFANEEHYKEDVTYTHTHDIVINIRQVQRIIMKDTFLCKKYARYMIETIEDAKRVLDGAEKRLGSMIEVTTHEPTNEIYREYILKLDAERDALDGYLNLALLCVMPVANITKHFNRPIDEQENDGGLPAEFELVQEQFDIVHEQLNQLQELSMKCDGLVEMTDLCVQDFYQAMVKDIENLQENQLPPRLGHLSGPQRLNPTYFDPDSLHSTNKWVPDLELERIFNTISDPDDREREIARVARRNEMKANKAELDRTISRRQYDRFGSDDDDDDDDDDGEAWELQEVYNDKGELVEYRPKDRQ